MTPLVIGLGNPDRGDDAVGPRISRAVAAAALPGVDVVEHEDPLDLVLTWAGRSWAVVADAVVSGAPAGTVLVAELVDQDVGSQDWTRVGLGGTHAFGLSEAVELSRSLGRLPGRVTLVGVEAADVTPGTDLTDDVSSALPEAVARIRELVLGARAGGADVPR